jgi:hypothetical protein
VKSVTIIISHFESLSFLEACIRQIRKHENNLVHHEILIADQSCDKTHNEIIEKYWGHSDIRVIKMKALYSGYGLDYVLRYADIKTDYICQIHVDVLAIHKNWLLLPIKLIEENGFSFVGQLQFINNFASIYPPNPIFAMAQSFNVARTETYKELSLRGGFTRFHNRTLVDVPMKWESTDWEDWAAADYQNRGSDDDIVAFCWQDKHTQDSKLALRFTGMIEKQYGRVIEGIVFHFGSCLESRGVETQMGERYVYWINKIKNGYGDNLIEKILNSVVPIDNKYGGYVWDGKKKEHYDMPPELEKRIEELKNEK